MNILLHHAVDGSGKPLVLISGLNADLNFWNFCLPHLTPHFQVIRADNRGIGKTVHFEPECTTDLMAKDIINLMDHLEIEKADIVGHSLGGCAAQKIAIHFPSRVNRLVLCSTQAKTPEIKHHHLNMVLDMMKANLPRELIVRQALTWLYSNNFFKNPDAVNRAIQGALSKPLEENRKSYFYQIEALLNHDTSTLLHQIQAKTLVIGGKEDISVPISELEFLASRIRHSSLEIIPDVAHLPPIETAEAFCEKVTSFLKHYPELKK
jgi:pimeloyl-ACP methyl ester carboxylesterase